jgi:ATP-dependent Lhr-like helicase
MLISGVPPLMPLFMTVACWRGPRYVNRMTIATPTTLLPERFAHWFDGRGWAPRQHQLEMLEAARAGVDALLIAPTGGGKTLGGFLPSLVELSEIVSKAPAHRPHRLHTLYISPLKALSVDVARNLMQPIDEMGLDLRVETRTGDTSSSKRQRQRARPPDILLTTPEQLALFCASANAERYFCDLRHIIIDEIHALAPQKRGDLLSLGLAALTRWAPKARRVGLSATVADEAGLARWLMPQAGGEADRFARLVRGQPGARPEVEILDPVEDIPWAGHSGRHAFADVYARIKAARLTLIFVNTRSQAELTFQSLWGLNEDGLAIALHHGSLAPEQRRKVEAAMSAGKLKAVVCTSTLDLGIDWGDVDLVIQMGAPKGSSRLIQRLGRSNHRLDSPSKALLAPSNRFEHLECEAAREAVAQNALDGEPLAIGALDVLAQHIMGRACGEPFAADDLFDEIRCAAPYAELPRAIFDDLLNFVATGGYSLNTYDRFRRLVQGKDGLWRARDAQTAQRHRLNVGTIVEAPMLDVVVSRRGRGGHRLGQVEEWFIEQLVPGDTFLFAGQVLRFEAIEEMSARVSRSNDDTPKIPSYQGGKFPLSTYLAARVRDLVNDPTSWAVMPEQVREWLELQRLRSQLPAADGLLVETFPRAGRFYLVCYPFEGRLAHQTLGMLLTRRLERMGMRPMGFVANEYALSVWGLRDLSALDLEVLFAEDMMGDDLDAWLAESDLMKRTFRNCAIIAGLIERRYPGQEKSGRQVTFSTDLIYNVLREHEPNHILLQAAWNDAGTGLLDVHRLGLALERIQGRITHQALDRISPLAVPVMLEIGKEAVYGEGHESILVDASDDLIAEAMRLD